jgi:predicted small secreted protein
MKKFLLIGLLFLSTVQLISCGNTNSGNGANISFKSNQNTYLGRINVYTYDGMASSTTYELYKTGYDSYAVKPIYPLHDNSNNSMFNVDKTSNNNLFKYTFWDGWGWYYFNL